MTSLTALAVALQMEGGAVIPITAVSRIPSAPAPSWLRAPPWAHAVPRPIDDSNIHAR